MRTEDEDTGEAIRCPYCETEDWCKHYFAAIDRSFLECSGGYARERFDELSKLIEAAFRKHLQSKQKPTIKWEDYHLQDLWDNVETESGGNEVYLDGSMLIELIVELFGEADTVELDGVEDDGPGLCSAMSIFYAEDAKKAFDQALADLSGRLTAATQESGG